MKIYIAASLKDRKLASETKEKLEKLGITVTSHWIENEVGIDSMAVDPISDPTLCREYAKQDIDDIMDADALMYLDGFGVNSPGKNREFGIAIGNDMKIFYISMAYRSVFDFMPNVKRFDTVDVFVDWYKQHKDAIDFLIR